MNAFVCLQVCAVGDTSQSTGSLRLGGLSCSGLVMVNVTGDEKFLFICFLIIKIIFLFYFFHLQRLFFCVKVPLLASWCVTKQHLIKALNQFYFDM